MSRPAPHTRNPLALALAVAALAAACTDSPTTPTRSIAPAPESPSLSKSSELNDAPGHARVMHTRDWFANDRASRNARANSQTIIYHGGPVLRAATNVAAVYWASSRIFVNAPAPGTSGSGSGDASLVGFFLNHLGGSPYFNINTTYTDGSGAHIANVVNYT